MQKCKQKQKKTITTYDINIILKSTIQLSCPTEQCQGHNI